MVSVQKSKKRPKYPAENFTISEPQNQSICKFYVRRSDMLIGGNRLHNTFLSSGEGAQPDQISNPTPFSAKKQQPPNLSKLFDK